MDGVPLAVFGYAFGHRKTQDFLFELAAAGWRQVVLLAAPWQQLPHHDGTRYFSNRLRDAPAMPPRQVCRALGFRYCEVAHDEHAAIDALRQQEGIDLAVIAGARILKRKVIDLFPRGVVNFHPGKLPETAGLDAFFYTVARGLPLGVTTHFIDHRIDAGEHLFFEETDVGPDDAIDVVLHNHYQSQIRALRRWIALAEADALGSSPIDRPARNAPMDGKQKRAAVCAFPTWRSVQFQAGEGRKLHDACRSGDQPVVAEVLSALPHLVEHRTPEGWTPLILASFNDHFGVAAELLRRGADPNATGRKGTTVLMYAKTPLLGRPNADYRLLEVLIDAGADLSRRDMYGRDICDYVAEADDARLLNWLRKRKVEQA